MATSSLDRAEEATRRRHVMAFVALAVSLAAFVGQTECMAYLTSRSYSKPLFVMTVTHGSWVLLVPLQAVVLWLWKRNMSFEVFWKVHWGHLLHTAEDIRRKNNYAGSVYSYFKRTSFILAVSLNVAAISWYIAVNLTTASDLTAIYNCSAFFAYAFSIPLLGEPWQLGKGLSIALSILGVLIIAHTGNLSENGDWPHRALGNLIIGMGAVLYGLYEVLYKRIACPSQAVSSKKQSMFANAVAAMIGAATWVCMIPVLVIAHVVGAESFALPEGPSLWVFILSVCFNMVFSGSFLILMSLTSPVFGSVASLLSTFLVPLTDYLLFGQTLGAGSIVGGLVIVLAFVLMSWASWKEMQEDGLDSLDTPPP